MSDTEMTKYGTKDVGAVPKMLTPAPWEARLVYVVCLGRLCEYRRPISDIFLSHVSLILVNVVRSSKLWDAL